MTCLGIFARRRRRRSLSLVTAGRPGFSIGFESEEDWFEYRLENDPRFLRRIEQARDSLKAGGGVRLEDVETE